MGRSIRLLKIPLILFVLLSLYAYNDFITSMQAGFSSGQSRTSVYVLLLLIIGIQFLYLFYRFAGRFSFTQGLNSNLLLLLIWVCFVNVYNNRPTWIVSVHLFLIFWWIISYTFNTKYVSRNKEHLYHYLFFFYLLYGIYILINLQARNNIVSFTERDIAITGYSYYAIVFLPYILLIKKQWIRSLLLVSAVVIIISSFKRGPIIILPIMILSNYIVSLKLGNTNFSSLLKLILVISACVGFFVWFNSITGGALMARFTSEQLEDGSGRSDMWRLALNDIISRGPKELLIGKGSGSSIELLQTGVHNEWIEFLFSFGLVGVTLYALFCIKIIRIAITAIKEKKVFATELAMMVVFCLISGLFSGFFFQYTSFYFFSFIGICNGIND